jgi:hypothetical protein
MKIRPLGAELFQVDGRAYGQTDRLDEDILVSLNLANAPKNLAFFSGIVSLTLKLIQNT